MSNAPSPVDLAAYALEESKFSEAKAREARMAAEQHLIELVGLKDEGTTTVKTDYYKVSTVGKLTRSITDDMPPELWRAVSRVKAELDVSALKKLATENPDLYRDVCQHIITKPAKASAKVELIQKSQEPA